MRGATRSGARRHCGEQRGLVGVGARGLGWRGCSVIAPRSTGHGITTMCRATRSRWRGREGMTKNDNYRGGDDNYPRLVVKMGAWDERKDVAGTGRNSCR